MITVPELLAPAADPSCAVAALEQGADAVYIGVGRYNLRSRARNALPDELGELLEYARGRGRRVYVALNAMPDNHALGGIESLLETLATNEICPDAFIVSDPGVVALCRRYAPHSALHLSTQTGTFNSAAAAFWAEQGIRRIVLPRELTLAQIAEMCRTARIEMEVFIHGAMCMSISGRCLLGVYTGKRHPNQGDCRQPCRFRYRVSPMYDNETATDEWFTVEEGGPDAPARAFLFNSKDLCCLPILDRVVGTGVTSVKIEGRNRSAHYVSSVVKIYRAALDSLASVRSYEVKSEWREELDRLDHRPYTTGFYTGEYFLQDVVDGRRLPGTRVVAAVRETTAENAALVDVKNPFCKGDRLNVLPVRRETMPYDTVIREIRDMEGACMERALTNRIVVIETEQRLAPGDMLRRRESR